MTTTPAPTPAPIHLDVIDRQSVRALVKQEATLLSRIATGGGNVHQAALDRQDEIEKFKVSLAAEEAAKFSLLYMEELQADASATADRAAAVRSEMNVQQMQAAQSANNVAIWISIVVFFIILITTIKIFRG